MASFADHLTEWRENEQAFVSALTELRGAAAGAGLVLDQAQTSLNGWPYLLHAEVRPSGGGRILSGLDVGLNQDGEMLLHTLPGKPRTFRSFRPRDKVFYLRSFLRLVESALASRAG
jgi:hypothetical protein